MLKGDLATTPLAAVLTQLAETAALGCLHIEAPDGDEALVYVKGGRIYSIFLPGRQPQLGARLISSGALAPEALEEALEAQATELQGWRLSELLVHLGFVDKAVVEAFSLEQLRDACFEMSRWKTGKWKFRKNEKTREAVTAALPVPELLDEVLRREQEWAIVIEVIGRVDAVPVLGAGGLASAEMALNQDQWALLCKVDGERSVHQLARDCGFTDFEAGQTVSTLVMTGLLEIDAPEADAEPHSAHEDLVGDEEYADDEPLSMSGAASRMMAAFGGPAVEMSVDTGPEAPAPLGLVETPDIDVPAELSSDPYQPYAADEDWSAVPERSGSELSRLLGVQSPDDADQPVAEPSAADGNGYTSYSLPATGGYAGDLVADDDLPRYSVGFDKPSTFDESLSRVSEALSALLGAQPDSSADELHVEPSYTSRLLQPGEPEDAHERRVRDAAAAELAAAQAEMDEQRRRFEAARQRADAEADHDNARMAAAAEAERIAAEAGAARVAAEEAARVAEEAAHAAAEEAARVAAEEAARVAAEEEAARIAAEEAVRIAADEEAARVAAAAREAARVAAEEEAARAAAAEEAARVAAAEQAARVAAAEEAARVAEAEEAARVAAAAEEAAHAAAAEEAAHRAAADEAARIAAAADEAARVAAAEEAARVAAVEEAARVAAAEEAARVAAAEEDARRAAELSELEAAAAVRLADEAARAGEEAAHAAAAEAGAELARVAAEHEARMAADEAARVAAEEAARVAAADNARAAAAEVEAERAAAEAAARAQAEAAEFAALLDAGPAVLEPAAAVPAHAASGLTDMASLMRELSSLGLEDEPAPAPPPPTRPSPPPGVPVRTPSAAQADKGKKRKGLFGRG